MLAGHQVRQLVQCGILRLTTEDLPENLLERVDTSFAEAQRRARFESSSGKSSAVTSTSTYDTSDDSATKDDQTGSVQSEGFDESG